jgi:dipeptidyl aminopeptidase/acylaminoacyl peptidase
MARSIDPRIGVLIFAGLAALPQANVGKAPLLPPHQAVPVPLAVADADQEVFLDRNIALSPPNGRHLAWIARASAKQESMSAGSLYLPSGFLRAFAASSLRLTETASGKEYPFDFGDGVSMAPAWSKDGRHLAYISDRDGRARLWIGDLTTGKSRRVSGEIVRTQDALRDGIPIWSPDGAELVVKILPDGVSLQEANEQVSREFGLQNNRVERILVYRSPEASRAEEAPSGIFRKSWRAELHQGDLAAIDAQRGTVRRLSRGGNPMWASISPDGQYLLYQDFKGMTEAKDGNHAVYDAVVVSFADGRELSRIRHNGQVAVGATSWSPSGKFLTFAECRFLEVPSWRQIDLQGRLPMTRCGQLWDPDVDKLYTITFRSGQGSSKYTDASGEADLFAIDPAAGMAEEVLTIPGQGAQLIAPFNRTRVWRSEERLLYAISTDNATKDSLIHALDLSRRHADLLRREPKDLGETPILAARDVSRDGQVVVTQAQDAQHPLDLWVADRQFATFRRATNASPALTKYHFGPAKIIEWRDQAEGRTLRGALLLPPDYEPGRRYPMVTWVYGGFLASSRIHHFGGDIGLNLQLLATRGFVVLLPDTYNAPAEPMKALYDCVVPGVNKAIELGIADPARLGVGGISFGGYGVLALLVQTPRFKAAVASSGLYDLWRHYGRLEPGGGAENVAFIEGPGRLSLAANPWERRDRFIANSPAFFLDKVDTPLLLLHGALDTLSSEGPEAVYVGLRRLGKNVEYVKYLDGTHLFKGTRDAGDYMARIIDWYERHLGSRPSPSEAGNAPSAGAARP